MRTRSVILLLALASGASQLFSAQPRYAVYTDGTNLYMQVGAVTNLCPVRPGGYGDVFSGSNNVFAVGTTQSVEMLIVSNRVRVTEPICESSHTMHLWRGMEMWVDTNGNGWIVGPYSGLGAATTYLGRWNSGAQPPDDIAVFAWMDKIAGRFGIGQHLIVTNGDIEVSTASFIGPANAGDRPGKGLSFDAAGNATLSGTLNGIAPASWATNAGAAGGPLYGMSNGAWTAFSPGGSGDGTGDVSKAYVDAQDAALSNSTWATFWSLAMQTTFSNWTASVYAPIATTWTLTMQTAFSNWTAATYLGLHAKADDANLLDNIDSTGFYRITGDTHEGTEDGGGNVSTNWASLHGSNVNALGVTHTTGFSADGSVGGIYIQRGGDPVSDYTQATLTEDSAWHDLDLSAIIPVGAKAVSLSVAAKDGTVGQQLYIRPNGTTNNQYALVVNIQVANVWMSAQGFIALDSNRVVEYYLSSGMDYSGITVTGWFK